MTTSAKTEYAFMSKFRKRPVEVEAVQIDFAYRNLKEVLEFAKGSTRPIERHPDYKLKIITLEGDMVADPGDWIIKGVNGEFYPCKPDIFEKTYEPV